MPSGILIVAAAALIGLWLAFFFLGATAGGLIHLLPVAALALAVRAGREERTHQGGGSHSGEERR